jgi:hypothetical protein
LDNRYVADARQAIEKTLKQLPPGQRNVARGQIEAFILGKREEPSRRADRCHMSYSEFFRLVHETMENLHSAWYSKNFPEGGQ